MIGPVAVFAGRRAPSVAPRGVVVSAAGPQMRAALHELALPTFHRFAARWGCSVHADGLPTDGIGADSAAQQAKWPKIRLLREALRISPSRCGWMPMFCSLARTKTSRCSYIPTASTEESDHRGDLQTA
jgi:hypothetical protein